MLAARQEFDGGELFFEHLSGEMIQLFIDHLFLCGAIEMAHRHQARSSETIDADVHSGDVKLEGELLGK